MPDNAPPTQDQLGASVPPESLYRNSPQETAGAAWTIATTVTADGGRANIVLVTNSDGSLHQADPASNEVSNS